MEREESHRVRLLYAEMVVLFEVLAQRFAPRCGANSLWSNTHRLTALVVFKPGSEENGKPLNQVV